jgi:hypothetical protein
MANVEKRMAAALAAVNAYLQQEEETCCQQQPSASAFSQQQHSQADLNLWGLSGRQEMMSMRQLIQMKAFLRF